jgi:hypothetical protein
MLTPQQLYYSYSNDPCEFGGSDFVGRADFDVGKGTPYDLPRLSNFLKQLKYPCVTKAKHQDIETVVKTPAENASGIKDTGKNRLCLPFRFLQNLDVEAFSEIQPDIRSGTSHAIRNAVDITRACNVALSGSYDKWEHRTATEYKIECVIDMEIGDKIHEIMEGKLATSTVNMWVKSKAREWSRLKNAFDRINASSVHQIDAIRSILSWEKAKINL